MLQPRFGPPRRTAILTRPTKMLGGDTAYAIHAALVSTAPGGTLSLEERRYQLLLSEVRTGVEKGIDPRPDTLSGGA